MKNSFRNKAGSGKYVFGNRFSTENCSFSLLTHSPHRHTQTYTHILSRTLYHTHPRTLVHRPRRFAPFMSLPSSPSSPVPPLSKLLTEKEKRKKKNPIFLHISATTKCANWLFRLASLNPSFFSLFGLLSSKYNFSLTDFTKLVRRITKLCRFWLR